MKRMLLVAALMMGGVVASLAMPNEAEARPRRYYNSRSNARVYVSPGYNAPRAYYRSNTYYRSPYYNNYNYGYRGYGYPGYYGNGGYYGGGYGNGGVIIGGSRGGIRIGW